MAWRRIRRNAAGWWSRRRREWYVPCRNTAASEDISSCRPSTTRAAEETGKIAAVVHSHPDAAAVPSEADRVACEASGLPWYIVAVEKGLDGKVRAGEIRGFTPEGFQAPLLGRQFAHGVLDCYSLCATGMRGNAASACAICARGRLVGTGPGGRSVQGPLRRSGLSAAGVG